MMMVVVMILSCLGEDVIDDVQGDGEDDSAVVLSRDAAQSLQVSQLDGGRVVSDDLGRVSQSSAGLVFSLGSDHFSSGIPSSLSLSSHGSLEIFRNSDVLHLHPLHQDPPGVCSLVQTRLIK